jgi:type II secretory pathway component PulJ
MVIPSTRARISSGGTLGELIVMLLAVAMVALCGFILSAFIRASYHKKAYIREEHERADELRRQYEANAMRPPGGGVAV